MNLQVEDGKYYFRGDGVVVGPARLLGRGAVGPYHWQVGGHAYTHGGEYSSLGSHAKDLVAEVPGEEVTIRVAAGTEDGSPAGSTAADYAPLYDILDEATLQASSGKGKERHANGKPFLRQPIMETGRIVGPGFALGQVMKKAGEAKGMADRGEREAAVREILGAIVYAAAAALLIRETE